MKGKILYVTTSYYRYARAYSTRLVNLARVFADLESDVHVVADYSGDETRRVNETRVLNRQHFKR